TSTDHASFVVLGGGDTLAGTIWEGQKVAVEGTGYGYGNALLTLQGPVTNHGTLILRDIGGAYEGKVVVADKTTLVNAPGAYITVEKNAGGAIAGNLTNQGSIDVKDNAQLTIDLAGITTRTFSQQQQVGEAAPITTGAVQVQGGGTLD